MTPDMWHVLGTLLCVIGGYMAIRERNWFVFIAASIALFYAVPNLPTALAAFAS